MVAKKASSNRTRSLAYIALCVAITIVSAWVTIPLGPIPFTLQMFALTFAVIVLSPKEAIASISIYILLGALGAPVFSGMRGGVGILAGPTGGFLWGMLLGVTVAALVLSMFRKRGIDNFATGVMAGIIFTAISYFCGWLQFMAIANVSPLQSLMVTIAPFVIVDLLKILAATTAARAVLHALGFQGSKKASIS